MKKSQLKYKVATVQYEPTQFNKEHNINSLIELCEQAAREFQRAWSHHGNREVELQRMWGEHDVDEVTHDGIIFVGLDKLWARVRRENTWLANLSHRVHLVVFDEAHQSTAETYRLMVETLLLSPKLPKYLVAAV